MVGISYTNRADNTGFLPVFLLNPIMRKVIQLMQRGNYSLACCLYFKDHL